jgi:ionotropic glutamate receptor
MLFSSAALSALTLGSCRKSSKYLLLTGIFSVDDCCVFSIFRIQFLVSDKYYPCHVDQKQWKTYDALVGDVTILADRLEYVDFTQPYTESGLSMIVPSKPEESTSWIFLKPFTWEMWVVTGAIMLYTMLIIWFLEHQRNPVFSGPWKNQIGTTFWFTFSSLFFAHSKYQISRIITRNIL